MARRRKASMRPASYRSGEADELGFEASADDAAAVVPQVLHDAIEAERSNLSKADSVLGCLVISLEAETDFATGPYYPDVAQIARDLVRRSINGLDSLTLHKLLAQNKVKEDFHAAAAAGLAGWSGWEPRAA